MGLRVDWRLELGAWRFWTQAAWMVWMESWFDAVEYLVEVAAVDV